MFPLHPNWSGARGIINVSASLSLPTTRHPSCIRRVTDPSTEPGSWRQKSQMSQYEDWSDGGAERCLDSKRYPLQKVSMDSSPTMMPRATCNVQPQESKEDVITNIGSPVGNPHSFHQCHQCYDGPYLNRSVPIAIQSIPLYDTVRSICMTSWVRFRWWHNRGYLPDELTNWHK